ncbi:MAG: hypothetical protein V9E96_03755 [Chitinophagaceae bacterium]
MKLNRRSILFVAILVVATTLVKFICAPVIGLSGFSLQLFPLLYLQE